LLLRHGHATQSAQAAREILDAFNSQRHCVCCCVSASCTHWPTITTTPQTCQQTFCHSGSQGCNQRLRRSPPSTLRTPPDAQGSTGSSPPESPLRQSSSSCLLLAQRTRRPPARAGRAQDPAASQRHAPGFVGARQARPSPPGLLLSGRAHAPGTLAPRRRGRCGRVATGRAGRSRWPRCRRQQRPPPLPALHQMPGRLQPAPAVTAPPQPAAREAPVSLPPSSSSRSPRSSLGRPWRSCSLMCCTTCWSASGSRTWRTSKCAAAG
jgi:hypothetical protein